MNQHELKRAAARAALGTRHRAGDALAPRAQFVDEQLDRRAAADAGDGAVDEFVERRARRGAFEFVLVHEDRKIGVGDGIRTHDNRNHNPGLYP